MEPYAKAIIIMGIKKKKKKKTHCFWFCEGSQHEQSNSDWITQREQADFGNRTNVQQNLFTCNPTQRPASLWEPHPKNFPPSPHFLCFPPPFISKIPAESPTSHPFLRRSEKTLPSPSYPIISPVFFYYLFYVFYLKNFSKKNDSAFLCVSLKKNYQYAFLFPAVRFFFLHYIFFFVIEINQFKRVL